MRSAIRGSLERHLPQTPPTEDELFAMRRAAWRKQGIVVIRPTDVRDEVIHRRGPWRSVEAVEFATLEWVDWFNNRRLLEPIGNLPPAEAEAAYYAQLEAIPMAA